MRRAARATLDGCRSFGDSHRVDGACCAAELGLDGAVRYFEDLVRRAQASVPACEGAGLLRHLVRQESLRLVPQELVPDIVRAVA